MRFPATGATARRTTARQAHGTTARRACAAFGVFLVAALATLSLRANAEGLPMAAPEQVGMSAERLQRIRSHMQEYVDEGKLAGITTLVARHGKVAHLESVGMAHAEADVAMNADTLVRIYSMTKPITSVAVMMLYEQGLLRLTAPVSEYIPEFADVRVFDAKDPAGAEPDRAMTVRDLLSHTSGIGYGWSGTHVDKAYGEADLWSGTLAEMVGKLAGLPLYHHPGAEWHYGMSTDVLGYLVQVVSGVPFDEYLQREIFEPLGMADTAFHVPADKHDRFAANYGWDDDASALTVIDEPATGRFSEPSALPSGGGGLVSTAGDYFRFSQMMLNGGELDGVRLLGRKTVQHMTRDHLPPELSVRWGADQSMGEGFGLGFGVPATQRGEAR